MNEKQIEAIRTAQEICNLTAGNHNKAKTILDSLPNLSPERLREEMPRLKALLFSVDTYHQAAIEQLNRALTDTYPV